MLNLSRGDSYQIFITSHATAVLSYWGIPNMWGKMNEANTSFMAELYWIPILFMVFGCGIAVTFWYDIIRKISK